MIDWEEGYNLSCDGADDEGHVHVSIDGGDAFWYTAKEQVLADMRVLQNVIVLLEHKGG